MNRSCQLVLRLSFSFYMLFYLTPSFFSLLTSFSFSHTQPINQIHSSNPFIIISIHTHRYCYISSFQLHFYFPLLLYCIR
ncbi:hypothetical protein BDA99DRAFT_516932 [Phascolomyces articulosus]|uniref:Uncharacterized protein n=1 Tax=Phascolomyces articulosus TaxID=60185 RepID=A0AAD5PBL5_9FUNG|nr:hypothetical protein BDA99DRAFT_516932 [Phascolomyces articulosus]